jgi:hypothetical protein
MFHWSMPMLKARANTSAEQLIMRIPALRDRMQQHLHILKRQSPGYFFGVKNAK